LRAESERKKQVQNNLIKKDRNIEMYRINFLLEKKIRKTHFYFLFTRLAAPGCCTQPGVDAAIYKSTKPTM
jgi:hypothetical protein